MGLGETVTPVFPGWFEEENPGFAGGMKQLFSALRQLLGAGTPALVSEGRPGYSVSANDAGIETYGQLKGRFATAADEYGRDAAKATAAVATSASETTRARGDFSSAVSSLNSRLAGMQGPAQGPVVSATTATLGRLVETVNAVVQRPVNVPQMVQVGWPHGGFLRDPSGGRTAPPTNPYEFKKWWDSLTPDQRDEWYARDPSIGNSAGMPFVDRDKYNRRHLAELIRKEEERVARLKASAPRGPGRGLSKVTKELEESERTLAGYRELERALSRTDGPRFLGYLDDAGRGAVSIQNPDTAKYHATFIPGTGQDLSRFEGSDLKSLAMQRAGVLALGRGGSPGDVSVTTWMGYDRPMGLGQAASTSWANNGAADLRTFQTGLRASHEGAPSINTVIGHSYGSTVIGAAASGGHALDANNVVAVGSPGMIVDNASGLHLADGGRVFATQAQNDVIRVATGWTLGPAPVSPDFGARVFDADAGPKTLGAFWSVDAHSSYWSNGNKALDGIGKVIVGGMP